MVAVLLAADRGEIDLVRSAAHYAENAIDPDPERRAAVSGWLEAGPPPGESPETLRSRFSVFRQAGLGPMDALHLAWAEALRADVLLTTDDRFKARAMRLAHTLSVRVMNPIALSEELHK